MSTPAPARRYRRFVALCAVSLALVSASGCGADSDKADEPKAPTEKSVAKNIATHFGEASGGVLNEKDAACFGKAFVESAGLDALEAANLIDEKGEVQEQSTRKFDAELSAKYADAYLGCVDFAAATAKAFAKAEPALDETKLAACLKTALPNDLMKKVIVATQSGSPATDKDVTAANTALTKCQESSRKATQ